MNNLKTLLRNNEHTKKIYVSLWNKKNYVKNCICKYYFKKNAVNGMDILQKILDSCSVKYFWAFGTLLGIMRDDELIENDLDLDLVIYLEENEKSELIKALLLRGYEHLHSYYFNNCLIQTQLRFNKVMVDLSFVFEEEEFDSYYLMYNSSDEDKVLYKITFRKVNEIKKHEFRNILVNIPESWEEYLEDNYGSGWRIPDSKYKFWENPLAHEVHRDKIGTIYDCIVFPTENDKE